jgi:sugar lactone lactonase YvrE
VSTYASGLTSVSSIAFDGAGNLYVTYETHGQIIKITPSGAQSVFATLPGESEALAFDSKGNLFAGTLDGYVYKITTSGSVSQFSSQKIAANRVAIDSSDDLYYTVGAQVDKLSPTGTFTTFGTGSIMPATYLLPTRAAAEERLGCSVQRARIRRWRTFRQFPQYRKSSFRPVRYRSRL